jgi:hypothetical protein
MRVIVHFDPPMATAKLRDWKDTHGEALLSVVPENAIRIDVGRAIGGDFARLRVEDAYGDIASVITSTEPMECQECHWKGQASELRRVTSENGTVELLCPSCEQAHYIFPPT